LSVVRWVATHNGQRTTDFRSKIQRANLDGSSLEDLISGVYVDAPTDVPARRTGRVGQFFSQR